MNTLDHGITTDSCLLLFSGGRDSTLAAVRLAKRFTNVMLATVTSGHLIGIERVRQRLRELRQHLSPGTEWLCVGQPSLNGLETLQSPTCLPCHRGYVVAGVHLAKNLNTETLAFGYAGYQNDWPEQTPQATERLRAILQTINIRLELPVYDIKTKEEAVMELRSLGLSDCALEQKCLQQQHNVELPNAELIAEIARWDSSTRDELSRSGEPRGFVVHSRCLIASL